MKEKTPVAELDAMESFKYIPYGVWGGCVSVLVCCYHFVKIKNIEERAIHGAHSEK